MIPRHTSIPQIAAAASRDEQSARDRISVLLLGKLRHVWTSFRCDLPEHRDSFRSFPIATYTRQLSAIVFPAWRASLSLFDRGPRRPRCRAARRVFLDAALSSRCIRERERSSSRCRTPRLFKAPRGYGHAGQSRRIYRAPPRADSVLDNAASLGPTPRVQGAVAVNSARLFR